MSIHHTWTAAPGELEGEAPASGDFGRYELGRAIGSGGMGVVYEAHDALLDRVVAIKVVRRADPEAHALLRREAVAMARLSHPNVATIYDLGVANGRMFIAMELVRGGTLRDRMGVRFGWRDQVALIAAAARGLVAAHAAGVLHRDFKPDNVLLGPAGVVRVTDFGLASVVAPVVRGAATPHSITGGLAIAGTRGYIAPEAYAGACDAASDQYALAVTAYEVLEGARPYDDRGARRGWQRADLPAEISSVFERALALQPIARHRDLDALLAALDAAVAAQPADAGHAPLLVDAPLAPDDRASNDALAVTVALSASDARWSRTPARPRAASRPVARPRAPRCRTRCRGPATSARWVVRA